MIRLVLLTFLVLSFACLSLQAEIASFYTFTQETHPYNAITGTVLPALQADEALDTLDIGFGFPYGAAIFTQLVVSSNGWVGLGNTFENTLLVNQLNSTMHCPVIAPLWDDLSMSGGDVSYLLSGVAPQRLLTIQYSNAKWNYSATNHYNFQIRLYETGRIEFCYGAAAGNAVNPSASIGINMSPGGIGNFYSVTVANPATVSNTTEQWNNMAFPANGTSYIFNSIAAVPNDLMAVGISGNSVIENGTTAVFTVSVNNFGTETQSDYSVQLQSVNGGLLGSLTGVPIAPGQTIDFPVQWVEADSNGVIQIIGKVVLAGDAHAYNDNTNPMSVYIYPAGNDAVTIGTGNELARIPYDFYYRYGLYETLYYPAEINTVGFINGITLYKQPGQSYMPHPLQMWLGETAITDLSANWIPAGQLVQVFNQNIEFPTGTSLLNLTFDTPYYYTGGNLVLLAYNTRTDYSFSYMQFQSQTVGNNRARKYYSDTTDPNPLTPPAPTAGQLSGQFPKTTFIMQPVSVGQLSGVVYGVGDQPLSGALVSITGTNQTCLSSVTGTYSFAFVPVGNREITISKIGYVTQTQNAVILENQNTVLNVTLVGVPFVSVTGRVVRADNPTVGIAGATVFLDADSFYNTGTNAGGYFTFDNIQSNRNYVWSADAAGFESVSGNVDIGFLDYDFGNVPMNIGFVAVNGRIIHALDPTLGIAGVTITLTGNETFTTTSDAQGYFLLDAVQSGHGYDCTFSKAGYVTATDTLNVGYVNYNMQNIALTELLLPPIDVNASIILMEPFPVTIAWDTPVAGNNILSLNSGADNSRQLLGYLVYQLLEGQEANQTLWTTLTPQPITENTLTIPSPGTPFGLLDYKWAVKAVYTTSLTSTTAFSNTLPIGNETGRIHGMVRNAITNIPVRNCILNFSPNDSNTSTDDTGQYSKILLHNTYSISINQTGYEPYDTTGIVINNLDDITFDILLNPIVGNSEDNQTVLNTGLSGCYPNPFVNSISLDFRLKEQTQALLGVYNIKGQKVKSLYCAFTSKGIHNTIWDGRDDNGSKVAPGVYYIRMQAGKESSLLKVLLLN